MPAIISDKFRIFNAKQFLESLSEGASDTGAERSRMYFFVGRPQPWRAQLEIFSKGSVNFTVGHKIFVGTIAGQFAASAFKATIAAVYENALLLTDVFPTATATPTVGSVITATADNGSTIVTNATAKTGLYRYATEDVPPLPLDNQEEKYIIYDELIAAKRITDSFARAVIRRYNWDLTANPKFDMWKPDYSANVSASGQVGKTTAVAAASSIADAKFYVMNSQYQVWKCLYNGQTLASATGQNANEEPLLSSGNYSATTGLYKEATGAKYIWRYMYTIPTDDVLRFLSSDFMPIVLPAETSRVAATAQNTANGVGAIDTVIIKDAGAGITPASGTFYAPIKGDGGTTLATQAVAKITIAGGVVTGAEIDNSVLTTARGGNYTYGNLPIVSGTSTGLTARGLFTNTSLTTAQAVTATTFPAIEVIIAPQGGHCSDYETELNAKRVMTNIRLTYSEGSGDFPVDNDFRRIGIIRDPFNFGTTTFSTADTLSGVRAIKITGAAANYIPDERIQQTVTGGTAYGTVVSWTLDSGQTTTGVLKYIQTHYDHLDNGELRVFSGANAVTGALSGAAGTANTGYSSTLLGVTFASGYATPEVANNSGDIIYIENRRLITRAADQIEDIKLVIEF